MCFISKSVGNIFGYIKLRNGGIHLFVCVSVYNTDAQKKRFFFGLIRNWCEEGLVGLNEMPMILI